MFGGPLLQAFLLFGAFNSVSAIFCYKCEGTRDFRCSDPMDPRPFPLYDCDSEPWARDKKPVFCEKVTEFVGGLYRTTRGCSRKQWEDVNKHYSYLNQRHPCTHAGRVEVCLCNSHDGCNSSHVFKSSSVLLLVTIASFILFLT
eukprot:TRINITY_DN1286_c0_g1_i1.p1 TRINITY_DN1286_c0_g1~~TRINITY_DN1286_c0_g1_i1.p1  ORF type:complete len:144 (+),score=16.49 TRINITY_DN1286_c0_g1_i1:83-514(+)